MNSSSWRSAAMVSGARQTSRSTLPPPSLPGNAEILPSNLFARPLRNARGSPHPKSFPSYMGNRGELPIVMPAPSGFPSGKHRGAASHSATARRTASSPYATTLRCSSPAAHRSSLATTSPTTAVRSIHRERHLRARIVCESEHSGGVAEEVPAEVRRFGGAPAAELGPDIEEVPEGGAVGDSMVDDAPDEEGAIAELSDSEGSEGPQVALVADGGVEGEQGLDGQRDVG
ncbi:hypothetical protein COCNU_04G000550 [Cocos nucifera]|uniref:Uncharacterized protein n=1 Tax=Cocos nucifera TaxID=13894 RepID=A0A8K0I508_COCNU|nr:hypothetical protein COCNU_04G000550 [Cocos nucifera]